MTSSRYRPYQPQMVPVSQAEGLWTIEGPEIAYRFAGLSMPCPTRMTAIRLTDGSLWLHSPIRYSALLGSQMAALGPVTELVAPNDHHYIHLADWAAAHPEAKVFAAPGLSGKAGIPDHRSLGHDFSAQWSTEIESLFVDIGDFAETVFFHRSSKTLIVTDLMQNFEPGRIANPITRLILQVGGATGPKGGPSIDVKLAIRKHRSALKKCVEAMIAWQPNRIILSHGRCYDRDAVQEIKRAFSGLT